MWHGILLIAVRLGVFLFGLLVLDADIGMAGQVSERSPQDESQPNAKLIAGEEIRLTQDGRLKHDPVFVDQGKSIVFTSQEKFNQLCLMKLELSDQKKNKPERLHGSANTSELMVSFAKKESRYAYLRNNGNLHFEIVLEDKESGTTKQFNPGGGFAGIRNISYAPDGSNVIFAFPDQNGPQQIKSLSSDGKTSSLLTNSEGVNICPKYSADGKQIVFASSRDGDFDIFLMNANGSSPRNISRAKGMDTHPVLSPDSKKIAFTGLRNGNYDIFVMDVDGTNLQRLTSHDEVDDYPTWSPDGKHIVWVGERDGQRDLYIKRVR